MVKMGALSYRTALIFIVVQSLIIGFIIGAVWGIETTAKKFETIQPVKVEAPRVWS